MRKTALALLVVLLIVPFVYSINITEPINESEENNTQSSLKIEIILTETVFLGVTYDSLFKITNLNHTPGTDDSVFIMVKYNITKNSSLVFEDYFNKTINYYSSSDTGRLFLEETGNYTLCGAILNTSFSVCKEFEVINPLSIPCFVEINLSTDKQLYLEKEQVKIKNIINNDSYPFIIEYWVEDLFGNEAKERYNTSNTNTKTYTPKLDENDRVFLVKSKLVFVACNNSNTALENQKMIVVKKEKQEKMIVEKEEKEIKVEDTKKSACKETISIETIKETGKIASFYTLSKKFSKQINLYTNIKVNGTCTLVLLSNKGEQKQSINGSAKAQFIVEPDAGKNLFVLELTKGEKIIDTKTLLVELENKENKSAIKNETSKQKPVIGLSSALNTTKPKALVSSVVPTKQGFSEKENEENKTSRKINVSAILMNNSLVPITGSVVYESSNTKLLKLAPFLVVLVLVLIVVGLIISKRR